MESLACKTNTLVRNIIVFNDYEDKIDVYKFKNNDETILLIKKIIDNELIDLTDKAYTKGKSKDINEIKKN